MASLSFSTTISRPMETVVAGFNEQLFRFLTKGFPPVVVEQFDGIHLDAMVRLRIGGRWGPRWASQITHVSSSDNDFEFTDVGIVLPPGLRSWRHVHRCKRKDSDTTEISDLVTFSAHSVLEPLYKAAFYQEIGSRKQKYTAYYEGSGP